MPDLPFALAIAAILATPGPTNTLLLAAGAGSGFWRALRLVPAELAGYLVAITAWGLILGRVVAGWPSLGMWLQLLSAAYLARMAARLWRGARPLAGGPAATITFGNVLAATMLNPKALIFAAGVFPAAAFASIPGYLAATGLFAATLVPVATAWVGVGASAARSPGAPGLALVHRMAAALLTLFSLSLGTSALL